MRAGSASAATRQSLRLERNLHRGFGRHIRRPKDRKYPAAQAARDFVRRLYHFKAIISSTLCIFLPFLRMLSLCNTKRVYYNYKNCAKRLICRAGKRFRLTLRRVGYIIYRTNFCLLHVFSIFSTLSGTIGKRFVFYYTLL